MRIPVIVLIGLFVFLCCFITDLKADYGDNDQNLGVLPVLEGGGGTHLLPMRIPVGHGGTWCIVFVGLQH
jgi:hypothetical protein